MTNARRILIFEPEATGHQMEYIRYLLTMIGREIENARVILLSTQEGAAHPNCERLVNDFSPLVELRIAAPTERANTPFKVLGGFYERQWRYAEMLDQVLSKTESANLDFILVPHLESIGLLQICLRKRLFRGMPWATIAIAIRFHHRKARIDSPLRWLDILQCMLFRRVIRDKMLTCFGTVNPYLSAVVANTKVAYCPEPCAEPVLSPTAHAREFYGIRPDTCLILVFGFIDRRKCVDILLEGVARATPEFDLTVLLAGPQHTGHMRPVLNGPTAKMLRDQGRLVEVNRFILSGTDIDPMSAADIAWVFYERDFVFNSNVLVRSGLSRRPVVARRQGVIGRLVEEHKLGLTLTADSPDSVSAALTTLAKDPELRREMGENGARAFAQNTPENFARPIVDAINRTISGAA
jgi:glycosyltransferase involved in cell wall biosynthesis